MQMLGKTLKEADHFLPHQTFIILNHPIMPQELYIIAKCQCYYHYVPMISSEFCHVLSTQL